MESTHAIATLAALAQPTRLETFRLLAQAEPQGLAAGDLARRLAVPANTMSSHLNVLAQCGLVRGTRNGRTIIYRAELAQLRDLLGFLLTDCCGGHADICAPLVENLTRCTDGAKCS